MSAGTELATEQVNVRGNGTSQQPTGSATAFIKDSAVAIPLFHLIVCSLFLLGYTYTFGGGIVHFLSITDIFSLSLHEIAYLYLILSAGVIALVIARARLGAWSRGEALNKIVDPEERNKKAEEANKRRRRVYRDEVFLSLLLLTSGVFIYLTTTRISYIQFGLVVGIWIGNFLVYVLNSIGGINGARFVFPVYGVFAIVMSVAWGMTRGDMDARLSFADLSISAPLCGNFVIIRPLSPMLLAVSKQNVHFIVDQDCRPKFRISREPERAPILVL